MVSPAGSWIAYIGEDQNVWLIHPDGSNPNQITSDSNDAIQYIGVKWSPNGKLLGFSRQDKNTYFSQIIIYDVEAKAILASIEDSNGGFSWFPDGERIIYDRTALNRGPNFKWAWEKFDGLYTFNLNTRKTGIIIAPKDRPLSDPQLSPDGNYVIFSEMSGYQDLMGGHPQSIVEIQKTTMFTNIETKYNSCRWSHRDDTLACGIFTYDDNQPGPTVILNPNGSILKQLNAHGTLIETNQTWSPDDHYIAVSSTPHQVSSEKDINLDIVSLQNGERQTIGSGKPVEWSPDGKRLLVEESENIYIMDVGLNEKIQLVKGAKPTWQPFVSSRANTNSWIAFIGEDHNVWLARPDGSNLKQITNDGNNDAQYADLVWSPKGGSLVFAKNSNSSGSSLWLLNARLLEVQQIGENAPSGYQFENPKWSPVDEGQILVGVRGSLICQIQRIFLKQKNPKFETIYEGRESSLHFEWFPDGSKIIFDGVNLEGKLYGIFIYDDISKKAIAQKSLLA